MNKLQQLRKKANLTMQDVATALNYKYKSAVNNIEKGRAVPNPSRIKRMSELYDCSIADIVNALIELEVHKKDTIQIMRTYKTYGNMKLIRTALLYRNKVYKYIYSIHNINEKVLI